MKSMIKWIWGLGCGAMLFVAGCASDGDSRSTGQVIDDSAIFTKTKAALINDPVVSAGKIDVDVKRGVVTLSGAVNSETEKRKAEEIVRGVNGVQGVANKLLVRDAMLTTTNKTSTTTTTTTTTK